MSARRSRVHGQKLSSRSVRSKSHKRNLDAYAIASHQAPQKAGLKDGRLGENLDDGSSSKRRRFAGDANGTEGRGPQERGGRWGREARRPVGAVEDAEEGSDSEGNQWTLGGLAEDDEDSDLDSEDAFGESDEERFEGFALPGSSSGKDHPARFRRKPVEQGFHDVDLSELNPNEESEDDEAEDAGSEGFDLATMLDDDMGGMQTEQQRREKADDESDGEHDHSTNNSDASSSDSDENSVGEAEDERTARLRDRLDAMDKNNKNNAKISKASTLSLTTDDLLADVDDATRRQYAAAIKTRKKSDAPNTLSAPLPGRQKDLQDRQAASLKAKEQLDRWRDTVIHNRRAEFLSLPFVNPDREEPVGKDKFHVDEKPRGELEEKIQRIMEECGIPSNPGESAKQNHEDTIMKSEGLGTNHLPLEEVMRRRADIRRARELLFREEIRAKRIARIKSKSYRRVHRKERKRQAQYAQETLESAGMGGGDVDADDRADRLRAEKRMSTKHRDSKWAKALKETDRAVWDAGARDAVLENARRAEELRKRMAGDNVVDAASDMQSEGNDMDDEMSDEARMSALSRLDTTDHRENVEKGKGLRDMKFMRDSEARQRARNDEDVERIRKELAREDGDEDDGDHQGVDGQGLGRAIFGPEVTSALGPADLPKRPELDEGSVSDEEEAKAQRANHQDLSSQKPSSIIRNMGRGRAVKDGRVRNPDISSMAGPNKTEPELVPTLEHTEKNDAFVSSWLSSSTGKSGKTRTRVQAVEDVAALDLSLESRGHDLKRNFASGSTSKISASTQTPKPRQHKTAKVGSPAGRGRDSKSDASDVDSESSDKTEEYRSAYQARAFAGDDVGVAFQAEKDEAADSEDEKEVSTHLPGWGSWAGEGLSKNVRKSNAFQRHNPLFKHKIPGTKPRSRQDHGLENVIISEKLDAKGQGKKSGKYQTPVLPHGYERREQYERSLRVPIGPEWTTKETFQRSIRPRIVVQPGRVIEAMKRPLV